MSKGALPSIKTNEERLQLAEQAMAEGELDLATHLFWEAVERDPKEIRAYFGMARSAIFLQRLEDAKTFLDAAGRLDPEHPDLQTLLGLWHEARGEKQEAIDLNTRAARANPRSFLAQFNLGRLLALEHRYESAIGRLREAERQAPAEKQVHVTLGICYEATGRGAEAIRAFGRAVQIDPLDPDLYRLLAELLDRLGQWEGAETALAQGLALLPRNPVLLACAVAHFMARGRLVEARRYTERLLELDPHNERALLNLTAFALAEGDIEAADRASSRILERHPDSVEAHFNLAAIRDAAGLLVQAEEHYRAALRVDPRHWRALTDLGLMLVESGSKARVQEGVTLLEKAVKAAPAGELRALWNLALGLWSLGRREEALQAAEQVLREAPPGHELRPEAERFIRAASAELSAAR